MKFLRACPGIIFLLSVVLSGSAQSVIGQPVSFSVVPADFQLFARDASNQGSVVVAGSVNAGGYQRLRLFVLRENKPFGVVDQPLDPARAQTDFRLASLIRAERAQYGLNLFLYRSPTDSVLVLTRKRLLCGDIIVIHGQSNAIGLNGIEQFQAVFDDTYLRNAASPGGVGDTSGQITWYPANQPFATVGTFGLSLQQYILDTYGIPTVIFTGALGGATLRVLTRRNPAYPTDPSTYYGLFLSRLQSANATGQVRFVVWRQGEAEAGNTEMSGLINYPADFAAFYANLQTDLNSTFRLYLGQINLLPGGNEQAGLLREFQRQTPRLFARTAAMATVGSVPYDGVHYGPDGYTQQAKELGRLIGRDIYQDRDTVQINAPSVEKIIRNASRDTLTLIFQPDQQLTWLNTLTLTNPANGFVYQRNLTDVFYPDRQPGQVRAGLADGNRVTLALTAPSSATSLTYLPPYFSDIQSGLYNGPQLTNGRGLRAFSFADVPIADPLPAPFALTISNIAQTSVQLAWTLPPDPTRTNLWLEHAFGDSVFIRRAVLPASALTYTDPTPATRRDPFRYRLQAVSATSESARSNVATAGLPALGLAEPPPPVVRLYPNPVPSGGRLVVNIQPGHVVKAGRLVDLPGRTVSLWPGEGPDWLLPNLPTGRYLAEITLVGGAVLRLPVLVY